jgi:hypothetical protein
MVAHFARERPMKIRISQLGSKQIETARGSAYVLRFCNFNQGVWYDSLAAKANSGWRDGLELEVEPSQIKSRTNNGRTYLTISAPPRVSAPKVEDPRTIQLLEHILEELRAIKAKPANLPNQGKQTDVRDAPLNAGPGRGYGAFF